MRNRMAWAGCTFFLACASPVPAQDFPTKPIRLVVPGEAGGSADILARMIGQKLRERFGQTVIVENRAGAGQMIGSDNVAKSPPDGHTLGVPTITYTTSAATRPKLPFDPVNDLTGVSMIGQGPLMLVVHPSLPVKSVRELISLAKTRPGQINYGTPGSGTIIHLVTEVFAGMAGIELTHVPYKAIAPAVTGAVSGEVPLLIVSLPAALPLVKEGRLRALAVSTARRSTFVPELPTISESGVPGYDTSTWWGILAPGKTPKEIINKLNGEIQTILAGEDFKTRLASYGAETSRMTADEFSALIRREIDSWRKVAKARNLKMD